MAAPSQAAVTPSGVRSGDPATLEALCARRGVAVLAYCERVCAPGRVAEGAADAFARFRAAVVSAADVEALDPDRLLLSMTRRAAAQRAPRPAPDGIARRLRRGHRSPCELVPELLVARAEGELSGADVERLEHHLRRCAACRAAAERFEAAEQAYRDPPPRTMAPEVERTILAALVRAAPVAVAGAAGNGASLASAPVVPDAASVAPQEANAEPPAPEPEPEPEPAAAEPPAPEPEPPAVESPVPEAAAPEPLPADEPPAPPPVDSPPTELHTPPTELHRLPADPGEVPAEEPVTGYVPQLAPDETYEHDVPVPAGLGPDETYEHDVPVPAGLGPDETYEHDAPVLDELEEPPATPAPPRRGGLGRARGSLLAGGRPRRRRAARPAREPSPLAVGPLSSSGRGGTRAGPGWRVALPTAIIGLALLTALAVAGVFSGASHRSPARPGSPAAVTPQNTPLTTPQPPPAVPAGAPAHHAARTHATRHRKKPVVTTRTTPATTTTKRSAPVASAPARTTTPAPQVAPSAPSSPAPTQTSPSRVQAVGPSSQAAPPAGNAPATPGYQPGG